MGQPDTPSLCGGSGKKTVEHTGLCCDAVLALLWPHAMPATHAITLPGWSQRMRSFLYCDACDCIIGMLLTYPHPHLRFLPRR